jgi:Polyketide cyclase / dehydrase and lipid transport
VAEIVLHVDIDAPPERVWAALVAWDTQGEWMLLTRVRGTHQDGIGVGGGIEGFTGIGPVGVLDTMRITRWDPPRRVDVLHTGRVVKGTGGFEVVDLGAGRSRFLWSEIIDLPLGVLGRLGFSLVHPLFAWGVRRSLHRFARYVEHGGRVGG